MIKSHASVSHKTKSRFYNTDSKLYNNPANNIYKKHQLFQYNLKELVDTQPNI